jgi:hypothetical protein
MTCRHINQHKHAFTQANWECFLMTIEVADTASLPVAQANKLKQMLDYMGSGVRQRFVMLNLREDLLEWAVENAKVSDVCREVKQALDAPGGNIPDPLVAKLLKVWLVNTKLECLQENEVGGTQAPANPQAAPAKKEQGDRSKSPLKKGPVMDKGMI